MDSDQLSETLSKLNNNLDPKSVSKKSKSEMLLQLEVLSESLIETETKGGGDESAKKKRRIIQERGQREVGEGMLKLKS